jgi:type I restriction enzyme, S subunit
MNNPIRPLGEVLKKRHDRATGEEQLLSVTASRGVVRQAEAGRRDISSDNKSNYRVVKAGDIVYNTMRMWQGVSGESRYDGIVSPAYTVCTPTADVDSRFIAYLLKLDQLVQKFARGSQGLVSDTWNLKYAVFAKITASIPSLSEQRKIADILDTVDELIRSTERLVSKMAFMRRAVLQHMMATVLGRSRNVRLAELGRIVSGATPLRSSAARYFSTVGLPWVKTLDLNEGIITSTDESITSAALRETACPILSPGTLLIAMYGGWAQIGRTSVLGITASINQAISAIVLDQSRVIPEYALLAVQHLRPNWQSVAASTRKDPNITRADVCAFQIPLPPQQQQLELVAAARNFDSRLEGERQSVAKLRKVMQGLMEDLLTGRVRAKVD